MKKLSTSILSLLICLTFSLPCKSKDTGFLPNKVTIAGKSGGLITKEEFTTAHHLQIDDSTLIITGFKFSLACKDGIKEISSHNDNMFTKEMIDFINDADSGCNFFIEYIRCKNTDNKNFPLTPLSFKIK